MCRHHRFLHHSVMEEMKVLPELVNSVPHRLGDARVHTNLSPSNWHCSHNLNPEALKQRLHRPFSRVHLTCQPPNRHAGGRCPAPVRVKRNQRNKTRKTKGSPSKVRPVQRMLQGRRHRPKINKVQFSHPTHRKLSRNQRELGIASKIQLFNILKHQGRPDGTRVLQHSTRLSIQIVR